MQIQMQMLCVLLEPSIVLPPPVVVLCVELPNTGHPAGWLFFAPRPRNVHPCLVTCTVLLPVEALMPLMPLMPLIDTLDTLDA